MVLNSQLTDLPHSVVFDTFDLYQSVEAVYGNAAKPLNRAPETVTEWLDDLPRLAVDRDGVPIVLHIPRWQRAKSLVRGFMCFPLPNLMLSLQNRRSSTRRVYNSLRSCRPPLEMGRTSTAEIWRVVIVGRKVRFAVK